MKGFFKIVLALLLVGTLFIVGCFALVGGAANEVSKELDRPVEGGISRSEFRNIEQGTTQRAIERSFGEPADSQEFEQQIPELQDEPSQSSCIYYPEKGKPMLEGASYQLCFDDGKLTSKNAY